jgi:hypothetical protein
VNTIATTRITQIAWGRMDVHVNGRILTFKDCKVWPGGAVAWDWTLTGTRHIPGIQPADIEEILAHGVTVMVLSRGMELMLHTCPETEALLRDRGIEYSIEETNQAVHHFNELMQQGVRVGGIFHSTC